MRILAFLTLPVLAMASMPAFAMEYSSTATDFSRAQHAKPRPVRAKSGRSFSSFRNVHRRGNRIRTIDDSSGLIITDYKPGSRWAFANQNYLPNFSENSAYEADDYRNRSWRLKKVSPGSVVASVKYRF
jgi:hypothetical protein